MFDSDPTVMTMTAVFEPTDDYRVELRRIWNAALPLLVVCMLNPSTADDNGNDPTILTLIHFARLWGYGGLLVVNLYSFCSSSPVTMLSAIDPIGPRNRLYVGKAIAYANGTTKRILVAWGNDGTNAPLKPWIIDHCLASQVRMTCLGMTASGEPKHPMARGLHRIPRDKQPEDWIPF